MEQKTATVARNQKGERVIRIRFPYDLDEINRIREIPGRKYHPDDKCWSAPIKTDVIKSLSQLGYSLDDTLKDFLQEDTKRSEMILPISVPGLKGTLFPYQNRGVSFIDRCNGRALIADEMGLGKTIQALAWLQLHPEIRPALIVVPASLKLNWEKEAEEWMVKPNTEILSGETPWKPKGRILIINYDILPKWTETIKKLDIQVIITDECHYFKNNKSRRTKAIKMISKGVPNFIALSGTPIENRPIEIYNAVSIIYPDLFPNAWMYWKRYCNAKHNGFGWDFNGSSNTLELHEKLTSTIMLRRLKKDVLPDLPKKMYSFVPIELNNEKEYRFAEQNFIAWVRATKGNTAASKAAKVEQLSRIEGLKQLAVKGKLKQAIEWIDNFLESDQKLVVFCTHHIAVDALMEAFPKIAIKLDGRDSDKAKEKAKDSFQTDPKVRLFIGNIKAAGLGITLTASSNVVFLELPWTPGALVQAEDRCHRIGQKYCVNIHYLLANDTIEEKIARLLDKKKMILDAVLDGKETDTESLLSEIVKAYTEE